MASIFDALKRGVGRAYDYATPGSGSSRLSKSGGSSSGYSDPLYGSGVYLQDPNKVRYSIGGVNYNYAGDPIGGGGGVTPSPTLPSLVPSLTPQQVYAPKIDVAGLRAQARGQAESSVNPWYTLNLNKFLADQARQREVQQKQTEMDVQNMEDTLKQTLEGGEIKKTRTAEDVSKNLEDIATTGEQFQTDTGQQFAEERLAIARGTAQAGLTGGLGAQQQEKAQESRNVAEQRQVQKFQEVKQQQQLFKGRTFEDIMRQGEIAKTTKEKGVKQAKFDLDNYIKAQEHETYIKTTEMEKQRQADVAAQEQTKLAVILGNYIEQIANPAKRAAAYAQYGGYM